MIVGATCDYLESKLGELAGQRLRIGQHATLIVLEPFPQHLLKTHRLRGYGVHHGTALHAWEYGAVQLFGELLTTHNDRSAWTSQRLMRCRSNKVHMGDRARMKPSSYQASDVGDVGHRIGADILRNAAN